MTSTFDQLASQAHDHLDRVFGDAVSIDGESGRAIVRPESDMLLGGGVQLVNGAHLMFRAGDFPDVALKSEVTHGENEYVITELDDVDSSGIRKARMARA